ncbi:hypothetical protein B9Z55_020729 [Caenorhabditis nigoni]|uniref:Uncharacterized protein n=1 Tax=Caenorhabditis nigoni TaxID=1611254 RepID=A0A2G5TP21_9PELO|nr:hypothetical protein B9Z55_020729 [Caenorhabditis nigoni]
MQQNELKYNTGIFALFDRLGRVKIFTLPHEGGGNCPNNATSTTDCLVIKNTGDCLLPDVQKYCDPKFLAMYKQYLSLRLYNLACDGRLRYRVPGDEPQNVLNTTKKINNFLLITNFCT